jgi:hypothetical protein
MSNEPVDEQLPSISGLTLSVPAIVKRPYTAPVLIRWGILTDVTRSLGQNGAHDGGKGRYHGTN